MSLLYIFLPLLVVAVASGIISMNTVYPMHQYCSRSNPTITVLVLRVENEMVYYTINNEQEILPVKEFLQQYKLIL